LRERKIFDKCLINSGLKANTAIPEGLVADEKTVRNRFGRASAARAKQCPGESLSSNLNNHASKTA
jgi:hypothetical protein